MFYKNFLLLSLYTASLLCINTGDALAQNASYKFRDLHFETHKGLPRFGVQNTQGLVLPGENYNQSRTRIQNNKELAESVGNQIEKHNYSTALLKRLDFISTYAECFKNMNKYEAKTEACEGFAIEHTNQGIFWKTYIKTMSQAFNKPQHTAAFCNSGSSCWAENIDDITIKNEYGKTLSLDEFQRRDFVSNFMKNEYQDFEQFVKTQKFHKEGYFVSQVKIGEYDFDKKIFNTRLRIPGGLNSQNNFLGNTNLSSRRLHTPASYVPTLPFEESMKAKISSGLLQFDVDLPMNSSEARTLSKGSRTLFAVTRIAFLEPEFKLNYDLVNQLAKQTHHFHYAANKVEFYTDEALTQKVMEVPLIATSKIAQSSSTQKSNKYTISKDSTILDYQMLGLHRLKQGNLLASDMKSIGYSVPANERKYWIQHKIRVNEANKPLASGRSKQAQERNKINKKRAEDLAKLSSVSWQDISDLSAEQQQVFYDLLTGKYVKKNAIVWPTTLPSVPWGMNLATIFRKGYFSDDAKNQYDEAGQETLDLIMEFGRDIANSQNLKDLTLVYRIQDVRYDQNKKALIVNQGKNPLSRQIPLNMRNEHGKKFDDNAQVIQKRAKGRAIYRLRSSTQNVGSIIPNKEYHNCGMNQKNKSRGCISQSNGYAQINFLHIYLALDKEIGDIAIAMAEQKGKKVARAYGPDAWRIVVELANSDMDVSQYDAPDAPKMEVITLFADVKRVLVIDPNGKIIWTKNGSELNKSAIVVEKPKPVAVVEPKVPTISAAEVAEAAAKRQRELAEQLKKKEAEQEKKRKEKQAKHEKRQEIRQCRTENSNKTRKFDKCEKLRISLTEDEAALAEAKENDCQENDDDLEDDMSEYSECDFGDVDMSQLSIKMQECMVAKCGATPTTMNQMTEYQACAGKIGKFMQIQMKKIMSAQMGVSARKRKPVDICKNIEKEIKRTNRRLNKYECTTHTQRPDTTDCTAL